MKDLHSLRGPQAFKLAVKVLSNDPEKPQDLVPLYLQKKKNNTTTKGFVTIPSCYASATTSQLRNLYGSHVR